MNHPTPQELLKAAKIILLVDWPDAGVPRALINAGFKVYSYSPGQYSRAVIDGEKGNVVFRGLKRRPRSVDIVNVFRPEEELTGIFKGHILPMQAKVLWLQPPLRSIIGRDLAEANNIAFVDGVAIADVANRIGLT